MESLTAELLADIAKLPPRKRIQVMQLVGKEEWDKCAADIFYWLDERRHPLMPYVFTQDPHPLHVCRICKDNATFSFNKRATHLEIRHGIRNQSYQELAAHFDELSTTRPFTMMPYFEPIIERWLQEQFFFVQKSRDMMATWLTVTMYTWDTLFHGGRQNIFQSEDATKTCELVKRSQFIYDNQPAFIRNVRKATYRDGPARSGILTVKDLASEILGFPQGADQIRQYHPSGVFQDEAAFQQAAGEAFTAIKPSIQNGGRFTAVSSANPSWFWLACSDRDQESI